MSFGNAEDKTIDGYTITDDLGHGAFGEVKKCIEKVVGCSRLFVCGKISGSDASLPVAGIGNDLGREERQQHISRNRGHGSTLRASQHRVPSCRSPSSSSQLSCDDLLPWEDSPP